MTFYPLLYLCAGFSAGPAQAPWTCQLSFRVETGSMMQLIFGQGWERWRARNGNGIQAQAPPSH
jgi:hypothetical protein